MSHVALLIPTLDRVAGAERQVVLLARGLAQRNWRVSLVSLSGNGGDAAADVRHAGAEFLTLDMRKGLADPRGWFRFHRFLRSQTPDVVHAHLPHASFLARWSHVTCPHPVLIDSIHTSATGGFGRRLGYVCSQWLPDRVSVVSQDAAAAYRSAGMVSPRSMILIPNGVDVEFWRPDLQVRARFRQAQGFGNEFLWFAAGRLHPVKDYPVLLRAMLEIHPPAQLVIAGAGPEEASLRNLALQFGIESRVRFLGHISNVLPWMQAADAFVLSSRWEGLPMSLLEAGACALPAVATDVPGNREVIAHGENGLLAKASNSFALRDAMIRMMCLQPRARVSMGATARCRVAELFSLENVLTRWDRLYRDLLTLRTHGPVTAPA